MTVFSPVSRPVRWCAFALAFSVGLLAFGGSASAGEIRLQYANSSVSDFGAPALSDKELSRHRGAGLDDEGTVSFEEGDDFAVILWDELKRNGNGEAGATSYNRGVDSSLSSTITGQAY